ncbi:hypothetical protein GQR58_019415 [Nymphon striatum]|nr:hypothetical protein GQR58_019415 [Nymphon striatum]
MELMMEDLLKAILNRSVSSKQMVDFLCEDKSEEVPLVLKNVEKIKSNFVPFFLNYLRERTSSLVQASHVETVLSLTPSKTSNLSESTKKKTSTNNSSRTRLFSSSESDISQSASLSISLEKSLESQHVTDSFSESKKGYNRRRQDSGKSNHYINHDKTISSPTESTPRYNQKTNFEEYMKNVEVTPHQSVNRVYNKNKHRSRGGRTRNNNNSSYIADEEIKKADDNSIQINDLQEFPHINEISNQIFHKSHNRIKINSHIINEEIKKVDNNIIQISDLQDFPRIDETPHQAFYNSHNKIKNKNLSGRTKNGNNHNHTKIEDIKIVDNNSVQIIDLQSFPPNGSFSKQ